MKKFRKTLCILLSVLMISSVVFITPIIADAKEITATQTGDSTDLFEAGNNKTTLKNTAINSNSAYETDPTEAITEPTEQSSTVTITQDYPLVEGTELSSEYEEPTVDTDVTIIYPWSEYDGVCGDYTYKITGDTTAEIVRYIGNEKNVTIPSEVNGYTVTVINSSAFEDYMGIESIVIPETIESFKRNNFNSLSTLTTVYFNAVNATGEERVFNNCNNITKVVIGDKVERIPEWAFHGTAITEITIPKSVKEIGKNAFSYTKLVAVDIPDGVNSVGDNAFYMCSNLTDFSSGAKKLGKYIFFRCKKLNNLQLREGLEEIGERAFYECSALTEVILPDSIVTIGSCAFLDCQKIKKVHIGKNIKTIQEQAFYCCYELADVNIPDGCETIGDIAFAGLKISEIVIPDSVTSMGYYAFKGNKYLKKVKLSKNAKEIPWSAFSLCTGLEEIDIPNGVTSIANSAFSECTSLNKISIPESVTSIGEDAFSKCTSLREIFIPKSVTEFKANLFNGCSNLVTIQAEGTITAIGENALAGTVWINNISGIVYYQNVLYGYRGVLPKNTEITARAGTIATAGGAFRDQKNLISITLPADFKYLGEKTFINCSNLVNIELPDSVTSIPFGAFFGCSSLKSIKLPKDVDYIGGKAFTNCKALEKIDIPDKVTVINQDTFSYCHGLTNVIFPDSLKTIKKGAFRYCTTLPKIVIPEGIVTIYEETFYECRLLSEVVLPKTLAYIKEDAFYHCNSLKSIFLPASIKNIYYGFYDSAMKTIIGFPGTYAETYAKKHHWEFVDIATVTEETLPPTEPTKPPVPLQLPLITDSVNSNPDNQVKTKRLYFYLPDEWKSVSNSSYDGENLDTCSPAIYWFIGPYSCVENNIAWPGYLVTEKDSAQNIFYADVPEEINLVIFNDTLENGKRTEDIPSDCYYHKDGITNERYGFYPDGIENFDNMIFVIDNGNENQKIGYGSWFYYYGDGTYGYYKTKDEAQSNNAVYSNGQFPKLSDTESTSTTPTVTTAPTAPTTSTVPTEPTTSVTSATKGENNNINPTTPPLKKANPVVVKAKNITVAAKSIKTKKVVKKAITISKAQGRVSGVISKITKNGDKLKSTVDKKFKLNTDGYLTIGKALKKGVYKITVKINAKGNTKYKSKKVTKVISLKVC